jgi:hypothetical protein
MVVIIIYTPKYISFSIKLYKIKKLIKIDERQQGNDGQPLLGLYWWRIK